MRLASRHVASPLRRVARRSRARPTRSHMSDPSDERAARRHVRSRTRTAQSSSRLDDLLDRLPPSRDEERDVTIRSELRATARRYDAPGPLLVLAGAGSGKTRVITVRIAELIRRGTFADRILAVTFTNKAAREMRERAMGLLGKRKKKEAKPEISTFHSLCVRILRRQHRRSSGTRRNSPSTTRTSRRASRAPRSAISGSVRRSFAREIFLQSSGVGRRAGSARTRPTRSPRTTESSWLRMAFGKYQSSLRAAGAVDFDDLLLSHRRAVLAVRGRAQRRGSTLRSRAHRRVPGHERHSSTASFARSRRITRTCAWSATTISRSTAGAAPKWQHILGFAKDWKGATVVRLEDNYRCRAAILELANTLIAHNKNRHGKVLRAARARAATRRGSSASRAKPTEAAEVVREIAGKVSPEKPDRVTAPRHRDPVSHERTAAGVRGRAPAARKVPYMLVGGQSFYDRKEMRDVSRT